MPDMLREREREAQIRRAKSRQRFDEFMAKVGRVESFQTQQSGDFVRAAVLGVQLTVFIGQLNSWAQYGWLRFEGGGRVKTWSVTDA